MRRKNVPAAGTHVAEARAGVLRHAVAPVDASSYFAALDADPQAFHAADLALDAKAVLFADWFPRAERDLPHLDAFLDVVRAGLPVEVRAYVAAEVLANLPEHLTWRAPKLIEACAALEPPLGELLRPRVLGTKAPARRWCLAWLAARGRLQLPADLPALLLDRDQGVRSIAVDWLEGVEPVVLAPIADLLREVASREKRHGLRRRLARVARAVPVGVPDAGDPDRMADSVGQQIAVEWDAGGGRVKARLLMRGLATLPDGSGAVVLADLADGAAAPSLRREARAVIASVASKSATFDDDVDRGAARRMRRGRTRRRDLERARRRLEDAMLRRRAVTARHVVALVDGGSLLVKLPGDTLARAADGALEDLQGRTMSVEPDALLTVTHPVELSVERIAAEGARLHRLEAEEAIPQVHREVRLVESHERDETTLTLVVGRPRFARAMWKRGWAPDPTSIDDPARWDAVAMRSVREIGSPPVRVVWSHPPTPVRTDPNAKLELPLAFGETVEFYGMDEPEPMPLGEVDPIVFSEAVVQLTPAAERAAEEALDVGGGNGDVDMLLELVDRVRQVPELSVAAGEALTAIDGAEPLLRSAVHGVRDPEELAIHVSCSASEVAHIVRRATAALEELLRGAGA